MFKTCDIPGHQGWRSKSKDLPKWKVPRHERKHQSQGIKGNVRLRSFNLRALRLEEARRVVGKVVAPDRAFFDFCSSVLQRFAHFDRHQFSKFAGATPQNFGRLTHQIGPGFEISPSPLTEGIACCLEDGFYLLLGMPLISFDDFAGTWIDRFEFRSLLFQNHAIHNKVTVT